MALAHNLGFPRIGRDRELKKALEAYWNGTLDKASLLQTGRELRAAHWQIQADAGLGLLPVGDFAWYDQVLTHSLMVGAVPSRFGATEQADLDTLFRMARGVSTVGSDTFACEMTKWFDTNYHYLVPEFVEDQQFSLQWQQLFDEVDEALALGYKVKPVVLGPLSYLWLGKTKGSEFDRLGLLERLLPVYCQIFERLAERGVEWVQIDEPALVLDLPAEWKAAYESAYNLLQRAPLRKLLTTYFGALDDNLGLACALPVDGLHVDLVRAPQQLLAVMDRLPSYKVLSLGVVNGRNIWRCDLSAALVALRSAEQKFGERLWVAPSCSLLHAPVDLERENHFDEELHEWLAFSVQKVSETALLAQALNNPFEAKVVAAIQLSDQNQQARCASGRIHNPAVAARLRGTQPQHSQRHSAYSVRAAVQQQTLRLPLLPTTTIGSFPQTAEIRSARRAFKAGDLSEAEYVAAMQSEIAQVIAEQEALDLDVLVHGEAERNDMVEYFGEQLEGYVFSRFGWVQSYGSRCVKPPIIYGDISRARAMTVEWARYAQSLTERPVKGMLTGPVTMLMWSFQREDVPREVSARQLALALRDEVVDLERAGINIIQIDEPAYREGLPLRAAEQGDYLRWASEVFRISASGIADTTQIHTHMCYSEFNDILGAIADMDADVITIETSRSDMELLDAFADFAYPNAIGPGVYDIHSPRIPQCNEMLRLLRKAARVIPLERLWVNPDCGLKTRGWTETRAALKAMVDAARQLRQQEAVADPNFLLPRRSTL
ncbi:5-methyltetrahydropteroyltriglutamate--homocysteine S-methyltransferase [Pseudomonas sp. OIL-1]|uniref:5-methyltetrahydropteroyltriglutamate-- homocysteine S-methyltransferase n=1 Tax=Pseudomonas sp. OIL-1 TaxID=2706126 RepID=UPI0013A713AE|nr:5-methyltetrahydropteroyltriglutamate--homocysteine S-methyltransferase [Pseudomonas sp. OIL-1]QIB51816.1 5-methyltetrahydropteroyltriglutamate--homocysteine S-methyltransferase [Pseudomonas sp. OIL-1]